MLTLPEGSAAFLRQAHHNNWHQYLTSLQPGSRLGWDVCVLTASDERQAAMVSRQLQWRREAGLLPARTTFIVAPDPDGRRIGSGGATLRVLGMPELAGKRALIIHSGGDSRRLPHCSATGKLFARVPRELPDGRASTLFDEFLIELTGLTADLPPGVLIAAGDVLLVFDHLQLLPPLRRPGVVGVAAAAPADMGLRHGVFVPGAEGDAVRAYLHKPGPAELAQWGAAADGQVQIDTGLVWLDAPTAAAWAALCAESTVGDLLGGRAAPGQLNLYGDLLLPMAQSTTREAYLADASDGPATPAAEAARAAVWRRLRGTPFSVAALQPAMFIHFGSSEEYWRMLTSEPALRQVCHWTPHAAAWLARAGAADQDRLALVGAAAEGGAGDAPALLVDSRLGGPLRWRGRAIVSGVATATAQALALGTDWVVSQVPVMADGRAGWVTRVYGIGDNPKRAFNDPAATYLNRPWAEWLTRSGMAAEDVWPDQAPGQRSLWNARLFPLAADREESLRLALAWAEAGPPAGADAGAERWSLERSFRDADADQLLADLAETEDHIAVRRFLDAVAAEQPAAGARRWLGPRGPNPRRCQMAEARLAQADPLARLRGYQALCVASNDAGYEARAFEALAEMVGKSIAGRGQGTGGRGQGAGDSRLPPAPCPLPPAVSAAARIDFGGGWTDTPPYSIERGGCVLNAALTLRGAHPVTAEAGFLNGGPPRLVLESRDIGARFEPRLAGQVLNYANPADPFALLKAALVVRGVVPFGADPDQPVADLLRPLGAGLWLRTHTSIPRGSGLGTSSILAGVVLEALGRLLGQGAGDREQGAELFDEVLWLEQLITTGGGWQDQVGGLTGGVKLARSEPGLPQRIRIEPVALSHRARAELDERLMLVYTGQQRLAKNLLQRMAARWMARDTETAWMLGEIARLAVAMRDALAGGDLDSLGWLIAEHWAVNRRMDPGCTNSFIDGLFEAMQPYISGAKLAGAGGGGFAIVLAKDGQAAHDLENELARRYAGTPVGVWPCDIPEAGLQG